MKINIGRGSFAADFRAFTAKFRGEVLRRNLRQSFAATDSGEKLRRSLAAKLAAKDGAEGCGETCGEVLAKLCKA